MYNTLLGAAPCSVIALSIEARRASSARSQIVRRALWGMALTLIYSFIIVQLLKFGISVRPLTHDESVYLLDAGFGFAPSQVVAQLVANLPWLSTVAQSTYNWIGSAIVLLFALQLRRNTRAPVNIMHVMVVSGFAVAIAYHLYPITGPQFAFSGIFPDRMPPLDELRIGMTLTVPAERNGMPSMHFGWALAMALMALHEARFVRIVYVTFAAVTAVATLSTGHHYLVDLIVALPFMLSVMAVCSLCLPFDGLRKRLLLTGAALYGVWLLALWYGIPMMVEWPPVLWVMSAATIFFSVRGFHELHSANGTIDVPVTVEPDLEPDVQETPRSETATVYGLFFVSGAAALIYQVLFSKQLTYVFGSMSTATNSVLATYMAGLALGAWLGGMIGPKTQRPIALYAYIELAIAGYCALSPQIFEAVQGIYLALGHGLTPDAKSLLYARFMLGALCLIVPTVLMGITLPLLARFFEQRQSAFGVSVGALYASNTLGAALGAIMAGYFILPALGVAKTTLVAVLANVFVAGLALDLHKRLGGGSVVKRVVETSVQAATQMQIRSGKAALIVLLVGGFVTLALEVNYIHLLAVAAGNSTYAFSLMLFAFLIGLGGGAECGRRVMSRFEALQLLAWLELALCVTIVLSFRHINALAEYFAVFGHYPISYGWGGREVIRGIVCCIAMIPPAFLIGAIFPVAIDCVGEGFPQRRIRMLGVASALNTMGNIAGVLVAGFIFLPLLGSERSLLVLACVSFALSIYAIVMANVPKRHFVTAAGAALVLLVWQPASLNYNVLTTGANVYFAAQNWGEVIDHAESLDGGLTSVNVTEHVPGKPVLTLLTNGKFQGNNSDGGEMVAQMGFALAPLLHTSDRDAALVVGYGTGNTSKVLHDAGYKQLDVVDLSADIFRLANEHFGDINGRVTEADNVNAYVTDGRNFLLLTENTYDLISMEISSIWFAGAASLYSSDYYALAKKRLTAGGVLQQWMQLHHASPIDIFYILGSMRLNFDYVWVYVIGSQGIVVASDDPRARPAVAHVEAMHRASALSDAITAQSGCAGSIAEKLILSPPDLDRFLDSLGIPGTYFDSNDDNAFLEYNTPKGNALNGQRSFETNLNMLAAHSSQITYDIKDALRLACDP